MNTIKFLTVSIALVVVATACASAPTPTPPPTPVTVQLTWIHQAQWAGVYAAAQRGDYANEGLAVTLVEGGLDVDWLMPVLNGTAQFGLVGADELIVARSQGKPVRAVATIYRRSPVAFASLAEKGMTRPQDLIGKKIRTTVNTAVSLRAMMTRVGIAPDQYTEVNTLPSDVKLFASGDVPVWGVFITSLGVSIQQAGYKLNLIYPDDYGVHFYSDTLFTTDDLIATNPDLVRRFVRATLKGLITRHG